MKPGLGSNMRVRDSQLRVETAFLKGTLAVCMKMFDAWSPSSKPFYLQAAALGSTCLHRDVDKNVYHSFVSKTETLETQTERERVKV